MNERLTILLETAKDMAIHVYSRIENDVSYELLVNEIFAELIVRECMQVARGADGLDATHEAWYLIKEHFGVE